MKNNQNTVSVIIPVYNRVKVIDRSINSVINQTYPINQIIVIDDGSNDGTYDLVKRNFPQVIVKYQENKGVSNARNVGINSAKSNWIAFLDSDDEWLQHKLQCQMDRVCIESESHVVHTNEIWIRNGVRVNPMRKHEKKLDVLCKCKKIVPKLSWQSRNTLTNPVVEFQPSPKLFI